MDFHNNLKKKSFIENSSFLNLPIFCFTKNNIIFPNFPQKAILGNTDKKFLDERLNSFQIYFDNLTSILFLEEDKNKGIFQEFLLNHILENIKKKFDSKFDQYFKNKNTYYSKINNLIFELINKQLHFVKNKIDEIIEDTKVLQFNDLLYILNL